MQKMRNLSGSFCDWFDNFTFTMVSTCLFISKYFVCLIVYGSIELPAYNSQVTAASPEKYLVEPTLVGT